MVEKDQNSGRRSCINRRNFITTAGAAGLVGLAGCSGGGGEKEQQMTAASSGSGGSTDSGGSSGSGASATMGENSGSTVTLRIWSQDMADNVATKQYWVDMSNRFNSQSNDVKIKVEPVVDSKAFEKVRSAVQQGADAVPHFVQIVGATIYTMNAGKVLHLKEQGLWEQSEYISSLPEGAAVGQAKVFSEQNTGEEGAIALWPSALKPYYPVYRKDWLDAAGLSVEDVSGVPGWYGTRTDGTDFDLFGNIYPKMNETELAAPKDAAPDTTAMKKTDTEQGITIYMSQWGVSEMGPLNNAATRSVLDTKRGRDVIRFQKEGIERGLFHPNAINHGDEEASTLSWSNKLGAIHIQDVGDLWASFRKQLGDKQYEENYTWGLPAKGPGSKGQKATISSTAFFIPFAKAYQSQAEMDASVEFMDFFQASDESLERTKKIGYAPLDPATMKQDWFTKTSLHEKYWSNIEKIIKDYTFSGVPAIPGATKMYTTVLYKMYQRIIQQGMSVEKATSIAAEEQNQILKDIGRYEPR